MRSAVSHLRAVLVVLLAATAVAPSVARAQPTPAQRVVVERFSGPRGNNARRALVRDLQRSGFAVVEEDEVRAAREQLGYGRSLEPEQYVELGRALNASAFIEGRVSRRRRRWGATARVRSAATGDEIGTESWGGRTAASLNSVGRSTSNRIAGYLAETAAPPPPEPAQPEQTPWYAGGADDTEAPPSAAEEEEEAPAAPRDASTRYDALRFAFAGGTFLRSMSTVATVYAARRGGGTADPARDLQDESRRYQSGGIGHFELGGLAEIYPGAFDQQPFPYLGLVVSFSHSVAVQSNGLNRSTGEPVVVPTDQLDFYVGARARYRFGPERREPEIWFDAGWGAFQFDLGLLELQQIGLDTIIPPMQHGYVQLGAGIRYGVVPTYLTLGLDFAGRIGTNIGGDTRNVWGTQTGPANGFALGAEARVEIPEIVQGIFVALRLQYAQMITSFAGQVGCSQPNACDGYIDPWEDDRLWELWPVEAPPPGSGADVNAVVGGPQGPVTDHYFRLQVQLGYAFY